jgi:hypothetical protein
VTPIGIVDAVVKKRLRHALAEIAVSCRISANRPMGQGNFATPFAAAVNCAMTLGAVITSSLTDRRVMHGCGVWA